MKIFLEKKEVEWPRYEEEKRVRVVFNSPVEAINVMDEVQRCFSDFFNNDDEDFSKLLTYMTNQLVANDNVATLVFSSHIIPLVVVCMFKLIIEHNLFKDDYKKKCEQVFHSFFDIIETKKVFSSVRELMEMIDEHMKDGSTKYKDSNDKDRDCRK